VLLASIQSEERGLAISPDVGQLLLNTCPTPVAACPLFAPEGEKPNARDPNYLIPLEPTIGIEPMTC
jgi:hypothetical protein